MSVFEDVNKAFDKTDHQILLYINMPFMEQGVLFSNGVKGTVKSEIIC